MLHPCRQEMAMIALTKAAGASRLQCELPASIRLAMADLDVHVWRYRLQFEVH